MKLGSLNEKWHGLPKWAWAAIVAVGLFLIFTLYKKRSSGTANATPSAAADTSGLASPSDFGSGGGGSGGPPPNQPADDFVIRPIGNQNPNPIIPDTPTPEAPPPDLPSPGQTASPTKPAAIASKTTLSPLAAPIAPGTPAVTAAYIKTPVGQANVKQVLAHPASAGSSGAAGVLTGQTKKNYQAKKQL